MARATSVKTIFTGACVWNLFWGVPLLLAPAFALTSTGLPEPAQGLGEFHARAVGLAVILFGWIYWTIGGNPAAYRPFLTIAILAKLAFFALVAIFFVARREFLPLMLISVGDLMFAVVFFRVWRRTGQIEGDRAARPDK